MSNYDPNNPSGAPNQPYQPPNSGPPQKKGGGGKVVLWILAIVGGLGLVGGLACCGVGFFGWRWVEGKIEDSVAQKIRNSPVVQEQLGDVQEVDVDWTATGAANQGGQQDTFVVNVKGSKGDGVVTAHMDKAGSQDDIKIDWAKLRTSSGQEFDF